MIIKHKANYRNEACAKAKSQAGNRNEAHGGIKRTVTEMRGREMGGRESNEREIIARHPE
jgi:hypothetical protein